MRGPLGAIVMAAPLGVAFAANNKLFMWFGIWPPAGSFLTSRTALIGYGSAFCFVWLLHRQVELLRMLERDWALNLIMAIGLITVSLALVGVTPSFTPIEDDTIRLAGAACYAVATWTATFAVIIWRFVSCHASTLRGATSPMHPIGSISSTCRS
jgi:hypothetical protein